MARLAKKFHGFGGTDGSSGRNADGSFARLTVAVNEAKESIGYGLIPFIGPLSRFLAKLAPIIAENSESDS
jgi:hypothetical protein